MTRSEPGNRCAVLSVIGTNPWTPRLSLLMAGRLGSRPMAGPMAPPFCGAMAARAAGWNLHTWAPRRPRPVFC